MSKTNDTNNYEDDENSGDANNNNPIVAKKRKNDQPEKKFHTVKVDGTEYEVLDKYTNLRLLSGNCCIAFDTIGNRDVVIKKLYRPLRDIDNARRAFRELKFMRLVDHPNIARLTDAFTAPQKCSSEFRDVYLVMELESVSPLYWDLGYRYMHMEMSDCVYQLLRAVKHLHSAGIIHKNLRQSRIGIADAGLPTIIVFDCGGDLSRCTNLSSDSRLESYYASPECILGVPCSDDPKTDIWSIACIMVEMANGGDRLFAGTNVGQQCSEIIKLLGSPSNELIENLPEAARKIVLSLPRSEGIPFKQFFPDDYFVSEKDFVPASPREARILSLEYSAVSDEICTHENSKIHRAIWFKGTHPRDIDYIDFQDGIFDDSLIPELNSENARDLLSRMLVIDPRQRISVDEALEHPYVKFWSRNWASIPYVQPPAIYDNLDEPEKLTIKQWERLIYDEIDSISS